MCLIPKPAATRVEEDARPVPCGPRPGHHQSHRVLPGTSWHVMTCGPCVKLGGLQPARLRSITARWRRAGYAATGRLGPGPASCWLTLAGMDAAGFSYPARRPAGRISPVRRLPFQSATADARQAGIVSSLRPGSAVILSVGALSQAAMLVRRLGSAAAGECDALSTGNRARSLFHPDLGMARQKEPVR